MAEKMVFFFGDGTADGDSSMKQLLGGKGANLAEMTTIGVPVPPGFTISCDTCNVYFNAGKVLPEGLEEQVEENIAKTEAVVGKKFRGSDNPLLFSVRSGAPISMPGMMDTVLNLGLNDAAVVKLAERSGNARFVWDCYRRLIAMYGDVVMGMKPESKHDHDPFEAILDAVKEARGVKLDNELDTEDLMDICDKSKAAILERTGQAFPQDPMEQLWGAIKAVFDSWHNDRALKYRQLNGIDPTMGTAVNVQTMVFGNMGDDCATGVAFTRDPATGEHRFFGEYLVNAQGEDVVAGTRTPQQINLVGSQRWAASQGISEAERAEKYPSLEEIMPELYTELDAIQRKLEDHYTDMQDVEFTIEQGRLWMLQTRTGKRTSFAATRIAVEMVDEGRISKEEALLRVPAEGLGQLLSPIFAPDALAAAKSGGRELAKGLNAGPGAATGRVVFSAEDAEAWYAAAQKGEKVDGKLWDSIILTRNETSPEDIRGMAASVGILTAMGGSTSHAALVARQMGKVCVAGCGALTIDYAKKEMRVDGKVIKEGDYISIDGFTGQVFEGMIETKPSEVIQVLLDKTLAAEDSKVYRRYAKIMEWADETRSMGVRTNADQPDQAAEARAFGAEGIGLCRTEHMFFEGDRIDAVREMILAENLAGREAAVAKLLPMQRSDFEGIFVAMDGFPVTIRALDPPLHEFLPHEDADIRELAEQMGVSFELLKEKVESLGEINPMLGHRGCRLGIVYPEVTAMQVRAILEAACNVKRLGVDVRPEIMIPLVGHVNELAAQEKLTREIAELVFAEQGLKVDYMVGTMIELPRAALTADKIAEHAEFFSFGTNDLTQTTYGISRDDMNKFVPTYTELGVYEQDPFQVLDQEGVGQLVQMGVDKGRATRPGMKIGICGEHGGEPSSVMFCHRVGMNYVSCSPYRVPIARLAAAHAVLDSK
jgi:pyruvate,orthophosphate dikinase